MKLKILVLIFILLFIFSNLVVSANIENKQEKTNFSLISNSKSFDGYTLFAPEFSKYTYLINNDGKIVHKWKSNHRQALPVYLLENGNLLRGCHSGFGIFPRFIMGGFTGKIEMYNWEGELIWEFVHSNKRYCLHNDIEPLPNGNVLITVWEYKTRDEAITAGINTSLLNPYGGLLIDHIIEVEPIFPKGGNIVWEWHVWDHLIQNYDPSKENYGVVADHPELININAKEPMQNKYFPLIGVDFSHINSIDYNEELDQILLSSCVQYEILVIDHNTTTEEAAGHTGGNRGKGGDLLYRWGNPKNYHAGNAEDQKFFMQHDAQWIEPGLPGEGNILIFNNGYRRPDGNYSSVEEIVPPVDIDGNYYLDPGSAYGPEEQKWIYTANPKSSFLSYQLSGVQRLPNGNTLICSGQEGVFFEVTSEGEKVWEYFNWHPIPYGPLNDVFKIRRYSKDYPGLQKLNNFS